MSDPETTRTFIVTVGSVIVAIITSPFVVFGVRRARRKRRAEVSDEEQAAVAQYTADPGKWVSGVLRSNEQLTKRVERAEEKADRLEKAFDQFRAKDRKFRNALARWFVDIMAVFEQNHIDMPYPRPDDEDLLADVIPSALEATRPRPPRPAQ